MAESKTKKQPVTPSVAPAKAKTKSKAPAAPDTPAPKEEKPGEDPHELLLRHNGPTPKKKFSSEDWAILKKARHFRSLGHKRVGMLFSGGPAPGANAVIATATIQFLNDGYEVIGFYKGYEYLQLFNREQPREFIEGEHYKVLTYDDVTRTRQVGGSLLKTARVSPVRTAGADVKNPRDLAKFENSKYLYNVIDALEYLGCSSLISIGGDGSLITGYYLSLLGVPVVHVPKTIDNDYYGISWTFGFFSAIERARQDINIYNAEARTTENYFVLELMGRKAGWYTLGAGIAGEAIRMIAPEEFPGELDIDKLVEELVDTVHQREEVKKRYGVILVSEGMVEKLPKGYKPTETDQHGNVILREAHIAELLATRISARYKERYGRKLTVKSNNIGYTTRCIEPSAYDVILGSVLGMGAYDLVRGGHFAHMVSVGDNLDLKRVPFDELVDPNTFMTALRYVPIGGDFFRLAKSLEFKRRSHIPE